MGRWNFLELSRPRNVQQGPGPLAFLRTKRVVRDRHHRTHRGVLWKRLGSRQVSRLAAAPLSSASMTGKSSSSILGITHSHCRMISRRHSFQSGLVPRTVDGRRFERQIVRGANRKSQFIPVMSAPTFGDIWDGEKVGAALSRGWRAAPILTASQMNQITI